jgi:hypothetical protein
MTDEREIAGKGKREAVVLSTNKREGKEILMDESNTGNIINTMVCQSSRSMNL